MTGAIIIVGAELPNSPSHPTPPASDLNQAALPLSCVEVLGRSLVNRVVDAFDKVAFDRMTVLVDCGKLSPLEVHLSSSPSVQWLQDPWSQAVVELQNYKAAGIQTVVLVQPTAYAEVNVPDLLQFHQDEKSLITRAFSNERPLDLWVLDLSRLESAEDLFDRLNSGESATYSVNGYVNFLDHPGDVRRLVVDSLNNACHLRPEGYETRPGVWMSDDVEVHRGARIVAPAFLGRGSRIAEQCLITRCSNVEANCHVDYGTVVEDSSVFPNTYVGIGLDISHSVVMGNTLLNLAREVTLQISDQGVIRPNRILRRDQYSPSQQALRMAGTH